MVFLFICVLKKGRWVCVMKVESGLISEGWFFVVLIMMSGCFVVWIILVVLLSVVGWGIGCFSVWSGMMEIFLIFVFVIFFGSLRCIGFGCFFIVILKVLCIVVGMVVGLMI